MHPYELMVILDPAIDERTVAPSIDKFLGVIRAAEGEILAVDIWGKRRLAYPINKENEGVYTLINFTSEVDFPAELDRVYKITDGVLRSMIVAKEEAVPAKAETEAK